MDITLSQSIKRENLLKKFIADCIIQQRFFNYGRNMKLSKCIGLIGPRGSCKSVAAAALGVIDYLMPGYNLISNMGITWGVHVGPYIVGYKSTDLDKMALMKFDIEDQAAVLVDEVNIEFSEARRSMTNRNLIFNKILQQLRKRQMNMIYTVQHEMWIDNRLRWQTDIFIKTRDVCLRPGGIYLPYEFGEYANWKVFDMSGIFGQGTYSETMTPIIDDWWFNAKQWWNTYDTNQIQGIQEQAYKGEGAQPLELKEADYILEKANNENYKVITKVLQDLNEHGYDRVDSKQFYNMIGANDRASINAAGKLLRELGIKYNNNGRYYKIPKTNIFRPETMDDNPNITSVVESKEKDKVLV